MTYIINQKWCTIWSLNVLPCFITAITALGNLRIDDVVWFSFPKSTQLEQHPEEFPHRLEPPNTQDGGTEELYMERILPYYRIIWAKNTKQY